MQEEVNTDLDFIENIIGMSPYGAEVYLLEFGYFLNINSEDGKIYFSTCELNPQRVNVDVINGLVARVNGVG